MTGEYTIAVHALVYLNHKGMTVSSEVLAANICTNPARVRKVMAKLKKGGLVTTREGSEGGYRMARDPGEVSLCQIAQAVEMPFVACNWHSGGDDLNCQVASGMADVMDTICDDLNALCMRRLEQITIADIDGKLFHGRPLLQEAEK